MKKRFEVNLDEREMKGPGQKLQALRVAAAYSFPTADIEEMLAEIERGYSEDPS